MEATGHLATTADSQDTASSSITTMIPTSRVMDTMDEMATLIVTETKKMP